MSIIGQWKTKKILFPLEEEIKHYSKEELIEKGAYDESEMGMMFNLILDIKSDGTIESFIKLPAKALTCKDCGNVSKYEDIPAVAYKLGDINNNGSIDSMDYVLLKRAYFGTYKLKDVAVGDINKNGTIDSMDYVYLRRAYFGTYVIK